MIDGFDCVSPKFHRPCPKKVLDRYLRANESAKVIAILRLTIYYRRSAGCVVFKVTLVEAEASNPKAAKSSSFAESFEIRLPAWVRLLRRKQTLILG